MRGAGAQQGCAARCGWATTAAKRRRREGLRKDGLAGSRVARGGGRAGMDVARSTARARVRPRRDYNGGGPGRPRRAWEAAPAMTKKVLVVEDHEDTAHMIVRLLEAAGFEAARTATLQGALAACRDGRFDLLLCDITLPDGDGIHLPRLLADVCGGVPMVALTGWARDEDAQRCRAAGFAAHLGKPADADAILATVRSALRPDAAN